MIDGYDEKIGKWIIDTDPGVDDAFAIIFALNYIKDNLLALSIEGGNVGLEQCYLNAKKVCVVNGKGSVPVYKGCLLNLSGTKYSAEEFHGRDGLFDVEKFFTYEHKYDPSVYQQHYNEKFKFLEECSALKIIELVYKHDNVNILTLGPLTNLAVAFMLDPNIKNRINKLVVMGGSEKFCGNMQAVPEFNFSVDPIATKVIFDNFTNIVVYPWETSEIHLITEKRMEEFWFDTDTSYFCKEIIRKKESIEGGIFPDYGAAVAAFDPSTIAKVKKACVDVVIDSYPMINGAFLVEKTNNLPYKKAHKVEIIDLLDEEKFMDYFKKMIK
jgi:purine nucleosidase